MKTEVGHEWDWVFRGLGRDRPQITALKIIRTLNPHLTLSEAIKVYDTMKPQWDIEFHPDQ